METIISAQIRAARALLKITAQELADLANIGVATVRRAESDDGSNSTRVVSQAIMRALEAQGVQFLEGGQASAGPGVALRAKE